MINQSKYTAVLTVDYMLKEEENKYFDRKSAKVRPADIAATISAFANAEGGTIVIGISDKTRKIEGIEALGGERISALQNAPKDCCKPMPEYKDEFVDVINSNGKADKLLLLHIAPSTDRIIYTSNDSAYLRIGDKSRELKGDDLKQLEYSKNTRKFEDECDYDISIEDLDQELIEKYKIAVGAETLSTVQVLKARGFVKTIHGRELITNAAILLFAKEIRQFYPNCRIRFLRYDGNYAKVGTNINLIKDVNIEAPILTIIDKAKEFISTQLREFTALDQETGRFLIVPEYPEFAWLEGIVNAVTHREYALDGSFITVTMYNDRIEIKSPGRLPTIVTIENIRDTRFSRNPRIARVLTEMGWVRELNEGVKRIFSEMEDFFLEEPIYSEPGEYVQLTLKNNIVMRILRQAGAVRKNIGVSKWEQLDNLEKTILAFMGSRKEVKRVELEQLTGKTGKTITRHLNKLISLDIIKRNGSVNDPYQTYEIIN